MTIHEIKKYFESLGYKLSIRKVTNKHLVEYLEGYDPVRLHNLLHFYFGDPPTILAYGTYSVLLQDFDIEGYKIDGICKKCGCMQNDACEDPVTGTCFWLREDLCSACGTREQRQLALNEMKALTSKSENQ